ncbi:MAG: inositol monophosphatase family protein [Anaerolineales bacterium]|jgi:myo-inositol-1(or 4)-monophosphatase
MTDELEFAEELARRAGQLLLGCFSHSGSPTSTKKDRSVVTEADLEADRLIRTAILEKYPGDGVVTEELETIYPAGRRAVWVVDPLDGTTNFSLGLPIWGVSIARLVDGWPETAALYFPPLNEVYLAQKGQGAYFNGERLHINPAQKINTTTFFACCSRTHQRYDVQIPYKPRILGSAAFNLCCVARGMAVLSFEAVPKLWDLSAAWLVAREAGAVIESLDDSQPFPPVPGLDYAGMSFPTLAAPTQEYILKGRKNIKPR